jgi:riboflavin biosynthesis pyrimidine reductase
MKPYVICHMIASLDGGLHPSRFTRSPQGDRKAWSDAYERIHNELEGDAWIVGRVTMAEMSKAGPHAPASFATPARTSYFATRTADGFAVALDPSGKLHFAKPDIGGDPVVVLLGQGVGDAHLAELAADGVSYIVAETPTLDLAAMLETLGRELNIERLLLEGGGGINHAFFAAGLVDELSLLIAPALDGERGGQRFVEGDAGLAGKAQLALTGCERLDDGLLHLRYSVAKG